MGKMLCLYLIRLQNQVQHHHFLLLPLSNPCFSSSLVWFELFFIVSEQSDPDDGAAKPNPSLTREKDLVVNISDLDNIFDEDDEELGVRQNTFHPLNISGFVSLNYLSFVDCLHQPSVH